LPLIFALGVLRQEENMKMKSVKILGAVFASVLICSGLFAETKTVTMGVYNWEPFVSEKQENHGLLSEIIVAALERTGYTVVIKNYPFARIMKNLEDGEIDLAPAISVNEERNKIIAFTSPIYDLDMGFTFKKGRIQYRTITDLRNYKGGIMRGTFWVKELESAGIRYEDVTQQAQNIKKLAADRVDFVCMPKEIAFNLIKTSGEDPGRYDFGLFKKEGQPAGISKKTKFRELLDDFEKGLNIIKSDGTYERIVSKYK
jgi:polar amino acid transport system substrate-binding protein